MQTIRRWRVLCAVGAGLAISVHVGCQAQMAGMTLPSGRYLEHGPQYFPPDPDFPLTKELAYQEEAAGLLAPQVRPGVGPVPGGVAPVPPGAVPPPVPQPPAGR